MLFYEGLRHEQMDIAFITETRVNGMKRSAQMICRNTAYRVFKQYKMEIASTQDEFLSMSKQGGSMTIATTRIVPRVIVSVEKRRWR